jgi:hypothetical protein
VADSFNPYRDWLGLADGQRPTTYYGLFGLKPLEGDAEQIRVAVVRTMAKVRDILPGNRMREWQLLLNELSTAKTCLTDPAAKAAYDAQLREALSRPKQHPQGSAARSPAAPRRPTSGDSGKRQAPSAAQPSRGAAAPPPVAPPVVGRAPGHVDGGSAVQTDNWSQAGDGEEYPDYTLPVSDAPAETGQSRGSSARRGRRRTTSLVGPAIALLVIVVAGLAGVYVYLEFNKPFAPSRSPAKVAKKTERATVRKAEADSDESKPDGTSSLSPRPEPATLQKSLAEVLAALVKRDLPGARTALTDAAASARSPEEEKSVAKYKKLCDDVEQFLRVVGTRVSKFRAKEEITLGKTRILVVEAGDGRFSFKVGSKVRVCTPETIPGWLAIALVDDMPAGEGPSKEIYGAFLAIDPDGDRARAKTLWAEAAKGGAKIEELLPAIDSLPPAQ